MHDSFNELLVSFFRRFMFHQWEHCLPLSQVAKLTIQIQNIQACNTVHAENRILFWYFFIQKCGPNLRSQKEKKKTLYKVNTIFLLGCGHDGHKKSLFRC